MGPGRCLGLVRRRDPLPDLPGPAGARPASRRLLHAPERRLRRVRSPTSNSPPPARSCAASTLANALVHASPGRDFNHDGVANDADRDADPMATSTATTTSSCSCATTSPDAEPEPWDHEVGHEELDCRAKGTGRSRSRSSSTGTTSSSSSRSRRTWTTPSTRTARGTTSSAGGASARIGLVAVVDRRAGGGSHRGPRGRPDVHCDGRCRLLRNEPGRRAGSGRRARCPAVPARAWAARRRNNTWRSGSDLTLRLLRRVDTTGPLPEELLDDIDSRMSVAPPSPGNLTARVHLHLGSRRRRCRRRRRLLGLDFYNPGPPARPDDHDGVGDACEGDGDGDRCCEGCAGTPGADECVCGWNDERDDDQCDSGIGSDGTLTTCYDELVYGWFGRGWIVSTA